MKLSNNIVLLFLFSPASFATNVPQSQNVTSGGTNENYPRPACSSVLIIFIHHQMVGWHCIPLSQWWRHPCFMHNTVMTAHLYDWLVSK